MSIEIPEFIPPENPLLIMRFFEAVPNCEKAVSQVYIDPFKLDKDLQKQPFGYVGLGTDDFKAYRANRIIEAIRRGDPIEMPMISAMTFSTVSEVRSSITVDDGRHRLMVFQTQGYKRVPVVVPTCQKEILLALYGA